MTEQQKLAEELKKMDYEPLLPVEKKLIRWSICLGVALLFAAILPRWTPYQVLKQVSCKIPKFMSLNLV